MITRDTYGKEVEDIAAFIIKIELLIESLTLLRNIILPEKIKNQEVSWFV